MYGPGGAPLTREFTCDVQGIPALVAGCEDIVIASPPRRDGTVAPEIIYIAKKVGAVLRVHGQYHAMCVSDARWLTMQVGAKTLVLAGGAQAVAAMAYGTESGTAGNCCSLALAILGVRRGTVAV